MKAVIFKQHGGPEVLEYTDAPDPTIKANEVLVEVKACALNHLDIWARGGLPGIEIPLPHILGNDIAGVVREVGALVTWVRSGDEVMLQPGVSCGHCAECLAGRDNLCREYDILGYGRDGGYAQLVSAPAVNVIPKPKNLNWEQAAALPLVTVTAWHMLVTRAALSPVKTCWCTQPGVALVQSESRSPNFSARASLLRPVQMKSLRKPKSWALTRW